MSRAEAIRIPMLADFISRVMRIARYETLDDGTYYGEIPGFRGVWAEATNLEACRLELQEVLEEWIGFNRRLGNKLQRIPHG